MTNLIQKTVLLLVILGTVLLTSAVLTTPPAGNIIVIDDPTGMLDGCNNRQAPKKLSKLLPTTTLPVSPAIFNVRGRVDSANKIKVRITDTINIPKITIVDSLMNIQRPTYNMNNISSAGMTVGKWYKIEVIFYKNGSTYSQTGKIRRGNNAQAPNNNPNRN